MQGEINFLILVTVGQGEKKQANSRPVGD